MLVQNKMERGFLLLFFAVIGVLAGARGITGEGAAAMVLGALFAVAGIACGVFWFIQRGRPPGQIEVSSTAIVKWKHGGQFERVSAGPIRISEGHLGVHSTGWSLQPYGRPLEVGTAGSDAVRTVEVGMDLLGYHPFELQQVCAELGWTFVDRDGRPVA